MAIFDCLTALGASRTYQKADSASESESEAELLYDRRFMDDQFVLAPSTLKLTTRDFCYFYTAHKNSVRTLQETHYFSDTKKTRLMLFMETVAIYCVDDTLWAECTV
jgi:hypothetical protein